MDNLTQQIIAARTRHSAAKLRCNEIKDTLGFCEATLFLDCDYKGLGTNETTRKAAFQVRVLGKDSQYTTLKTQLAQAERDKETAWVALENLIDQRRAYENALRAEFIKGRYGVSVTVEQGDDYDDFELAVMAEQYFNE